MLVQACAVDDGGVHRRAGVVHHDDAGSFAAYVLHGGEYQALQDRAQVEGAGHIMVDPDEKLKQALRAVPDLCFLHWFPWIGRS